MKKILIHLSILISFSTLANDSLGKIISPKKLIFDGNSFMALAQTPFVVGGNYLPIKTYSLLTTSNKPPVFYYGVSGKQVSELITDLPAKFGSMIRPGDIVVMSELVNQLRLTLDVNQTYADLQTYCALVRSYGAKIYITNMIACSTAQLADDTKRTSLNALIAANWASFCDGYINVAGLTQFDSVADTTNPTYYRIIDNLHLSDTNVLGYDTYAQEIANTLNPLFP